MIKGSFIYLKKLACAWCIVPYDSKKRSPAERSQMLNDLGITKLAYDWRGNNIPFFDEEVNELAKHHIKLLAFWSPSDTNLTNNTEVNAVFALLKRKHIKTQFWCSFTQPKNLGDFTQDQKVALATKVIKHVAERADSVGCTIGLYNHNGWWGEPDNQLEVLKAVNMKNVGIVYNFNHAQDHLDSFYTFYPKILPHLIALNLAGLRRNDQHIYPISKDGAEVKMIATVLRSNYNGPIGIINEDTAPDAAVGLQMNMDGLRDILNLLGYKKIAATYINNKP